MAGPVERGRDRKKDEAWAVERLLAFIRRPIYGRLVITKQGLDLVDIVLEERERPPPQAGVAS